MKNIVLYILLPVISAFLCCCPGWWVKILGFVILSVVQTKNLINAIKQDKEVKKISKYDKHFKTQYDNKGEIRKTTIDCEQY